MLIVSYLHKSLGSLGIVITLLLAYACNDGKWIAVGNGLIESNSRLVYVDNQEVELSTFMYDSVSTSATGVALAGHYTDPTLGQVSACAFVSMGNNTQRISGEIITIDSIQLVLHHANFFYGDSLHNTRLNIHRLKEEVEPNHGQTDIYNTQQFDYEATPLASIDYELRPSYRDDIIIKLPLTLADELVEYLKLPTRPDVEQYGLHRFFKGICITADPSASDAIMGYLVNDTSCYINIYYRLNNSESLTNIVKISANSYTMSNHISTEKTTNQVLQKLSKEPIKSDSTQNISVIQSGLGIYTRVDFPSLRSFFVNNDNMQIARAELQICPAIGTFTKERPSEIYLYYADRSNNILTPVMNSSTGKNETAYFVDNPIFFHQSYFSWDVTQFIRDMVNTADVENYGLVIVPNNPNGTSFHPMLLANQHYNNSQTRLILYLLNHE